MKYSFHGFMTFNDLIDNTRHKDSPLGELSALSRTYATDLSYFTKDDIPGTRLIGYRSKTDNKDDVDVPLNVRELCLKVGRWLETKATDRTIGTNNITNRQTIQAEFSNSIKDIKLGRVVTVKNLYLPQFIEFKLVDTAAYEESTIKIWFSDPAFRAQYPFYEIRVIPISDNVDDFFNDFDHVKGMKAKLNLEVLHDKVNRLREESPFTMIKTYNYEWNGATTDEKVMIPWTILIYGGIGENLDIIKKTLVDYILKNSKKSRQEWEAKFPDLFVPTEYVIAPVWTVPSVPGYRTIASMFSPTLKYKDMLSFAKEAMDGYKEEHIQANMEISASLFKSLSFLVAGNPLNRLAPISWYSFYPQYALIASRTDDFNRMDARHQQMALVLNELLLAAENTTPDTDTGLRLTKLYRGKILYVSLVHENVQWLCVCKYNYTSGILNGTPKYTIHGSDSVPNLANDEVVRDGEES